MAAVYAVADGSPLRRSTGVPLASALAHRYPAGTSLAGIHGRPSSTTVPPQGGWAVGSPPPVREPRSSRRGSLLCGRFLGARAQTRPIDRCPAPRPRYGTGLIGSGTIGPFTDLA